MLTMRSDSLVGHLYSYWKKMGGYNKSGYKENLCHVGRICMFWVPYYWFTRHEIFGSVFTPIGVLITGAFLSLVVSFFWFTPLLLILGAVKSLILLILFAVVISVVVVWNGYGLLTLLKWLLGWTADLLVWISRTSFWTKFADRPIVWLITPWHLALAGLQIASFFIYRPIFLIVAAIEGVLILLLAIVILLALIARFFEEKEPLAPIGSATGKVASSAMGTAGTVFEYAKAKKHMICPYIEFV